MAHFVALDFREEEFKKESQMREVRSAFQVDDVGLCSDSSECAQSSSRCLKSKSLSVLTECLSDCLTASETVCPMAECNSV